MRDNYILDVMKGLDLRGDSYASIDDLYELCWYHNPALSYSRYRTDLLHLLGEGLLHQEGWRIFLCQNWTYESFAAGCLQHITMDNSLLTPAIPT